MTALVFTMKVFSPSSTKFSVALMLRVRGMFQSALVHLIWQLSMTRSLVLGLVIRMTTPQKTWGSLQMMGSSREKVTVCEKPLKIWKGPAPLSLTFWPAMKRDYELIGWAIRGETQSLKATQACVWWAQRTVRNRCQSNERETQNHALHVEPACGQR